VHFATVTLVLTSTAAAMNRWPRSRFSDASLESKSVKYDPRNPSIVTPPRISQDTVKQRNSLADELDYVDVKLPIPPADKASRILGIQHRASMEPIPASARTSIVSTRSARPAPPTPSFTPTSPLTSLYVVSGLPKSPHTWTLADPDAVLGLHHSDGAVSRFWRPEVLGSTVSPGGASLSLFFWIAVDSPQLVAAPRRKSAGRRSS
jgi:hypothetical protein